jgi:arylsulfatase A-like enzyme
MNGYPRDTSPNLDRLALTGISFHNCYSQSATTGASHASLFTSRYPQNHGVLANREKFPDGPSLMDGFRQAGYTTAGFVSSVVLGRNFGIAGRFDHFDDHLTRPELNRESRAERPAGETLQIALQWLKSERKRPVFVWIHLIDPHGPYVPPVDADRYVGDSLYQSNQEALEFAKSNWEENKIPLYQKQGSRNNAAFYIARYDAEIHYADQALGHLFEALREMDTLDNAILVVTADHGETMTEQGHRHFFSHSVVAYEEDVRVPLIATGKWKNKDFRKLSADSVVRLIDIAPTLLDVAEIPADRSFQGRSLFTTLPPSIDVFSFGAYGNQQLENNVGTQFTLLQASWRYIRNTKDGSEELYDHREDPKEEKNVIGAQPDIRESMKNALDNFFKTQPRGATKSIQISPEDEENMRSLGYTN